MAKEIKLKVSADMQEFNTTVSKSLKETDKIIKQANNESDGTGNRKLMSKEVQEEARLKKKENDKLIKESERSIQQSNDRLAKLKKQHREAETKEEKKRIGAQIKEERKLLDEKKKIHNQVMEMSKKNRELQNISGGNILSEAGRGAMQGLSSGGIGGAISGGLRGLIGGLGGASGALAITGILAGVNKLVGYAKESLYEAREKQKRKDRSILDVSLKNPYITDTNEYEEMVSNTVENEELVKYGIGQESFARNMSVFQNESGAYTDNPDEMLKSASEYMKLARLTNINPEDMMEIGGQIERTGAGSSSDLRHGLAYFQQNLPNFRQDDILDALDSLIANTSPIADISDEAVKNMMGIQAGLGQAGLSSEQAKKAMEDLDSTLKSGAEGNDTVSYINMKAQGLPMTMEGKWQSDMMLEGGISSMSDEEIRNYLKTAEEMYGDSPVMQNYALREFTGLSANSVDKIQNSEEWQKYLNGEINYDELMKANDISEEEYMESDTAKEDQAEAKKEKALDGIANDVNDIATIIKDNFWTSREEQKQEDYQESAGSDGEVKGFKEKAEYALDRFGNTKFIRGLGGFGGFGITGKISDITQDFGEWLDGKGWMIADPFNMFGDDSEEDSKEDKKKSKSKEGNLNGGLRGNKHRMFANGGMTDTATTFTVSEHEQPEYIVPITNAGAMEGFGESMLNAMDSKSRKEGGSEVGSIGGFALSTLEAINSKSNDDGRDKSSSIVARSNELEARNISARESVLTKQESLLWMEQDNIKRQEEMLGIEDTSSFEDYTSSYDSSFDGSSAITPSEKNGKIDVNVNMELSGDEAWKVTKTHTSQKVKGNGFDLACVYKQGVK